jgi:hypothetical protein
VKSYYATAPRRTLAAAAGDSPAVSPPAVLTRGTEGAVCWLFR